ncbi:hypothetical protein VB618_19270 [Microvirga sp. CF3062]|uniref:hypothetical protein n=1 Tax=Microvirga sp. CF3062 TaxID=3110182 RepID=UPI002E79D28E|nr:hypothetical protein [Microvirga sp. CF3062]MEE1658345.1 hypothetical protein [Microvirga sp. CF3062]
MITHDCDVAQLPAAEPMVEIIFGRRIDKPDGNYTHAKNARRLHLPITGGRDSANIDLIANNRAYIPKEKLADYEPDTSVVPTASERSILQYWLAARYRRSAFPDEFDRRLGETGLKERLTKILKPSGEHITAVFFDVDAGEEHIRNGAEDTYSLIIYFLYSTEHDPEAAEKATDKVASDIEKLFKGKCYKKQEDTWQEIELVECVSISDQAMTYAQSLLFKRWSADHISFRAEPHEVMLRE